MTEHKKIFDLVHELVGNGKGTDLGKLENFLRKMAGMVDFAKEAKFSIEKGNELTDNHVNIEDVQIILEGRKEEIIELNVEEEIDNKKSIQQEEIKKQIEEKELDKPEKISEKEEIKQKPIEMPVKIKEIPLKLNIIEDPLKILAGFKKSIDLRPFITFDVAPRKNYFFVALLDDVNFFNYGKCKNCNDLRNCNDCKIHGNQDGVRVIFSLFFLDGNSIDVVAFNDTLNKYFKINRKTLIELTKFQKDDLRMKFLDLYRNRLLVFQAKFKDLHKTKVCTTSLIIITFSNSY